MKVWVSKHPFCCRTPTKHKTTPTKSNTHGRPPIRCRRSAMDVSLMFVGVRQQNGCFDTHIFIQFATYASRTYSIRLTANLRSQIDSGDPGISFGYLTILLASTVIEIIAIFCENSSILRQFDLFDPLWPQIWPRRIPARGSGSAGDSGISLMLGLAQLWARLGVQLGAQLGICWGISIRFGLAQGSAKLTCLG